MDNYSRYSTISEVDQNNQPLEFIILSRVPSWSRNYKKILKEKTSTLIENIHTLKEYDEEGHMQTIANYSMKGVIFVDCQRFPRRDESHPPTYH